MRASKEKSPSESLRSECRASTGVCWKLVSFPLRRSFLAITALLLMALVMTQAASTVCTAQCLQQQPPGSSTHCHSMLHTCPPAINATADTSRACNSSACGMDLLTGNQDRPLAQQRPLVVYSDSYDSLPGLDAASFPHACAPLRSSFGGPPMITALRI
jgi:hypothetical protein